MKNINYLTYFDENCLELFHFQYLSLKKVYGNSFTLYCGVTKKALKKIKIKYDNVIFRLIDNAFGQEFNCDALPPLLTKTSYARMLSDEIFPELFLTGSKFIYIDIDVMVISKISKYIYDDNNYAMAAVYSSKEKPNGQSEASIKWYSKKFLVDPLDEKFILAEKLLIDKIKNFKYFNSGVLIINNPENFKSFLLKIRDDRYKLKDFFDDQILMNLYNTENFLTVKDRSINYFLSWVNNDFADVSFIHFIMRTKHIMTFLYNNNLDYQLLERSFTPFLSSTFIFKLNRKDFQKDWFEKKILEIIDSKHNDVRVIFLIPSGCEINFINELESKNISLLSKVESSDIKTQYFTKVSRISNFKFDFDLLLNNTPSIRDKKFKINGLIFKKNKLKLSI